ncbi:GDSL esterase/lipase EXL3-like [Phragmites australis]|uniref:GDSL esterase/lipase EXL3-like n=1 Tax=Phragmites australis TaxID=29695 RepID=UPI002D77D876|nr:GDSL esterase/lipase EXL3-like [Phragmites australis]
MHTTRSMSALAVAVSLLLLLAARCHGYQYNATQGPLVTAVIVFGDSIVDPGNNNGLLTLIKANHPPYGKDFFNHEATGRYSNGLIPTDLIAQGLGVKQLLPAYLGVDHSPEDLLTGVSFASGATGFDPLTPVVVSVISLEQQLSYFDEYRGKLVDIVGEEETEKIIEGSLFVVCAGTDDVANTYFTTPFRSVEYDIPSYVDLLVSGAEAFLRKVSSKGARKIGFVGMPPVGCVPSQRTVGGGLRRECEPKRNQAAQLYNARIQDMIGGLNEEPSFTTLVVYMDIYRILDDLMERGQRYGFTETTKGCCGTGMIEVTGLCDSRFVSVCDDVSQHVFFDSYHPTEQAYRIIVNDIFDNYIQVIM